MTWLTRGSHCPQVPPLALFRRAEGAATANGLSCAVQAEDGVQREQRNGGGRIVRSKQLNPQLTTAPAG